MIKPNFYSICQYADYEKIFKAKGYAFFTRGQYNLNIIGVRSDNKNKVTNLFDDVLVVVYKTPTGKWQKVAYPITTEPGLYYMTKGQINKKGTSILVPGQYRGCWELGKHKGQYKALVQKKPVKVYRDGNKDETYDMCAASIDTGVFGINIHRSNEFTQAHLVNSYSAGCQVFSDPNDFRRFIALCEKQRELYGNSFTYTLLNESDINEW